MNKEFQRQIFLQRIKVLYYSISFHSASVFLIILSGSVQMYQMLLSLRWFCVSPSLPPSILYSAQEGQSTMLAICY